MTLEKHFGAVNALRVFSGGAGATPSVGGGTPSAAQPTGLSFLSAGRDSMLNMWSANGDCISSQTAHRGAATFLSEINYAAVLRQGGAAVATPLLASLGADNVAKIWDLRRLKPVAEIASPAAAGNVTKAVWCGQSLVVSGSAGLVRQYDQVSAGEGGTGAEWTAGRDLATHSQACSDLISADGFVASGSRSGQIFAWNL